MLCTSGNQTIDIILFIIYKKCCTVKCNSQKFPCSAAKIQIMLNHRAIYDKIKEKNEGEFS